MGINTYSISGLSGIHPAIQILQAYAKINIGEQLTCLVRIRYRQPLKQATLIQKEDGLYILFPQKEKGITPGQFAAWYVGEELIGSGTIAY